MHITLSGVPAAPAASSSGRVRAGRLRGLVVILTALLMATGSHTLTAAVAAGNQAGERAELAATAELAGNDALAGSVVGGIPVGDGTTATMTVEHGLNLRTGPGLDHTVVAVMPAGATVDLRGDSRDGFSPVSFDGVVGWAATEFLSAGDATSEAPAVDGSDGYSGDELVQVIYAAADAYGQPREDMLRVATCESELNPAAVNASSGASGLFQFMPSTWQTTPYASQDIFDPVANANAAAWMWSEGRRGEWSCQ